MSLVISLESATAKASGRLYEYVSLTVDGVELTRLFIKPTEKQYYKSLLGIYDKADLNKPIKS
jgi:hypothetical protein